MNNDEAHIETVEEARQGEIVPGMVTVLRVSVAATVLVFAILLGIFYGRTAGWFG